MSISIPDATSVLNGNEIGATEISLCLLEVQR